MYLRINSGTNEASISNLNIQQKAKQTWKENEMISVFKHFGETFVIYQKMLFR